MADSTPDGLNSTQLKIALVMIWLAWFGLLMGPIMSLAVVVLGVLPHQKHVNPPHTVLVWVHVGWSVLIMPVTFLIRRAIFSKGVLTDRIRPWAYFIGSVVFWTGCDSVTFFGIAVLVMNGSLSPTIFPVVAALALQAVTFPRGRKLSGGISLT